MSECINTNKGEVYLHELFFHPPSAPRNLLFSSLLTSLRVNKDTWRLLSCRLRPPEPAGDAGSEMLARSQTHRERLDLLLRFCGCLLQLRLRLAELALEGSPGSLQGRQLGLTLLQGQLQLRELPLQLQLLLLVLQADLQRDGYMLSRL